MEAISWFLILTKVGFYLLALSILRICRLLKELLMRSYYWAHDQLHIFVVDGKKIFRQFKEDFHVRSHSWDSWVCFMEKRSPFRASLSIFRGMDKLARLSLKYAYLKLNEGWTGLKLIRLHITRIFNEFYNEI